MTARVLSMCGRCPVCGGRLLMLAREGVLRSLCGACTDVDPDGLACASAWLGAHPAASLDDVRAAMPLHWSGEATIAWRQARVSA